MASSENQGKTIALVIFVVLFVTASAFAYYFFNQVDTYEKASVAERKKASDAADKLAVSDKNYREIKNLVYGTGGPADDHPKMVDAITTALINPNTDPKRKGVAPRTDRFTTY